MAAAEAWRVAKGEEYRGELAIETMRSLLHALATGEAPTVGYHSPYCTSNIISFGESDREKALGVQRMNADEIKAAQRRAAYRESVARADGIRRNILQGRNELESKRLEPKDLYIGYEAWAELRAGTDPAYFLLAEPPQIFGLSVYVVKNMPRHVKVTP